jgi:hypothetical protein
MATSTSNISKESVYSALKASTRDRYKSNGRPIGTYLITGTKAVVAADYDVAGDIIQLFEFPDSTYLIGGSIVADKDYDTGGTGATFDLIAYDSIGTAQTLTGATADVHGNQPANDGVEVISDAAGDTTQTITIVGTTQGTDTVVVETITLNGTTQVATSKTDWGFILASWVASGTLTSASTVTIREASANQTITTLTPAATSRGKQAVTDTTFGGRLIDLVAAGASTKVVGIKGTNVAGETIYDAQALNGTTKVSSNLVFATVTELYFGDVANATVVTVTPTEQLLISAATVFNPTDPTPMNFNGAAIPGSCFGMSVAEKTISLRLAASATTANTGTVTFSYKFLVYSGATTAVV